MATEQSYNGMKKRIKQLEALLKNSQLATIQLTNDNLITEINPAFTKLFGFKPVEAVGKHIDSLIVPPEFEEEASGLTGQTLNGGTIHKKTKRRTKDGKFRDVEIFAGPLKVDGVVVGSYGQYKDISEQRGMEEDLKKKEEKYRTILETMEEGYYEFDLEGNLVFFNDSLCRIYGYPREKLIGSNNRLYTDPETAEKVYRIFNKIYKTGKPAEVFNVRLTGKDGREKIVESSASLIKDSENKPTGFRGVIRDVTERKRARDTLRATEERFRQVVNKAEDIIYRTDENGCFTYINPIAEKVIGFSKEEISEKNYLEVISKDYREEAARFYGIQFIEKIPNTYYELPVVSREGKDIWIGQNVQLIMEGGNIVGFQSIARDITERKRIEKALSESEELLRATLESTADGVLVVQEGGKVIETNKRFARMWHIPEDLIKEGNEDKLLDHVVGQLEEPESFLSKVKELYDSFEEDFDILFFKDGRVFERFSCPLTIEEKITGRVWSFRDITASKQAEKALRESEARSRELAELLPETVFETDLEGNLTFANNIAFEQFGYSEQDFEEGLNGLEMIVPEDRDRGFENITRTLSGENIGIKEYTALRKDGSTFPCMLRSTAILDDGEPKGLRGLIIDISEKRTMEGQLQRAQKMEAIGTLAGGVAHDLNNILSGIVSYPELLLLNLPDDSDLRKPIATIQESGKKAAAIVQDLLTLARRGVTINEIVNLNDIFLEYLRSPEFDKLKMYHPNVQIESNLFPELLNISGSSIHLSKTIMNLISNAVEAMPDGGKVTVSTETRYIDLRLKGYENVGEGDYVLFSVSDTGIGISPKDLDNIFEPFYTKKVMGRSGTGLGMAVVWGTVKDHKGSIDVKSKEGEGTTFTLYFPATREKLVEDHSPLSLKDYEGSGESILVVDDIKEQRDIAVTILSKLGYSVKAVSSGEDAVGYIQDKSVDLLILDMIMDPGIDGLETYKRILETNPKQKTIITSGYSETDRVKEAQTLGAGAYLRKPYVLEEIGLAVKRELKPTPSLF